MSPRLFRALILGALLAGLAGVGIDAAVPSLVPHELTAAMEGLAPPLFLDSDSGWTLALVSGALIAVLIIAVAAALALFFFKPWGRAVSLWSTLLWFPLTVWVGSDVRSGWSAALIDLSSMLWGAVLAAAYWSAIAPRFERA